MKISTANYSHALDRLTELWDKPSHTKQELKELTELIENINAYEALAYPAFYTPITTKDSK